MIAKETVQMRLKNYRHILKIFTRNRCDKEQTISCLNNIAIVHIEQNNLSEASKYLFEALKIAQEMKEKALIASCYNNI
ncbi:MAG: tetratricopeptide repeat protein [Bacteroidetes bacterium]|nr:tetratricopeptide repeat protein [Bacteroidota bacterium]